MFEAGQKIEVDHIFPAQRIIELDGFNRLTKQQMENILQDKIGVGNLQALPKSLNASKGAKLASEWIEKRPDIVGVEYATSLARKQNSIQSQIQSQIDTYLIENAKRVRK